MRKRYYLVLLSIALITTSLVMMSVPVMAADDDVTFDLTAFYYSTSGIIPGVASGGYVVVDVYVDASALADKTDAGMMGWGLYVTVDPTVLTPYMAYGGAAGYFLYDWSAANWPPPLPGMPMPYPPQFVYDATADSIECSEMFLDIPTGAGGVGKLCSLYFISVDEFAYTELTVSYERSGYQDYIGNKYRAYVIDGHYNMPPDGYLFETPAGGTFPTGDPLFTDWHEIEPNFCYMWTLESWEDNGDGVLSPSDQIDMYQIDPPDPTKYWFHVEWVNPVPAPGDGIADMLVTGPKEVPEFPLGIEMLMMLAPLIPIIYVWRRKELKK